VPDVIDELQHVNALLQAEFLEVVERIAPELRLTPWYGTWSLRDLVIHIASWDEVDARVLEQHARGDAGTVLGWSGPAETDEFNARLLEAHAGESWDDALRFHRGAIEAHRAAAQALRDGVPLEGLWAPAHPVAARLSDAARHRAHHILPILEWEQASRP